MIIKILKIVLFPLWFIIGCYGWWWMFYSGKGFANPHIKPKDMNIGDECCKDACDCKYKDVCGCKDCDCKLGIDPYDKSQ